MKNDIKQDSLIFHLDDDNYDYEDDEGRREMLAHLEINSDIIHSVNPRAFIGVKVTLVNPLSFLGARVTS